jgi:hypothetical protein
MEQASAIPCLTEQASTTPCLMEQASASLYVMEQASATPEQNRVLAEMNLARMSSLARRSSLPAPIYRSNFIEKPAITL